MAGSIIALFGASRTGKTTVLRGLFEALRSSNGVVLDELHADGSEFHAVLKIENKKLGFTTQHMPGAPFVKDIKFIASKGCDVIVCETLSRGATVHEVERFKSKRQIEWVHQEEVKPRAQLNTNAAMLVHLWGMVRQALERSTSSGQLKFRAPLTLVSSRK